MSKPRLCEICEAVLALEAKFGFEPDGSLKPSASDICENCYGELNEKCLREEVSRLGFPPPRLTVIRGGKGLDH